MDYLPVSGAGSYFLKPTACRNAADFGWASPDPIRVVLDQVPDRLRPSQCFFSQFHCFARGEAAGFRWTGLARLDLRSDHGQAGWRCLDCESWRAAARALFVVDIFVVLLESIEEMVIL